MTDSHLMKHCQQALDSTRRHSADEVEVFGQTQRTISVEIEKADLQTTKSQQETMIGVRAFTNRQVGFSCSNSIVDLESVCLDAVKLAKASPADPNNVLPQPDPFEPVVGLYDPAAESYSASDAVKRAIEILEIAAAYDKRVIVGNGAISVNVVERCIVNSNGLAAGERGSVFSYYALTTARDGDQVSNMAFDFGASRTVAGIELEPVVRNACERALGSLGAAPGESFSGQIILSPDAVSDILGGLLLFQTNARNVLTGSSRWGDKLGQAIAHSSLTVVDDARLEEGVASSSFDREGVPRARREIIRDGELVSLFHNAYTSQAMGTPNTGHASGGARSIPGIGPTNLMVVPGDVSKDDLIADMKQGLLVTRYSGHADPISGDFSGVAKGAFLIKNGKIERPVSGTLIAGNAFDALRQLSGISSETARVFSSVLPYLRLESISVTAG